MMNTQFQKSDKNLVTYAEPGQKGTPYTRERYDMVGYIQETEGKTQSPIYIYNKLDHEVETRHIPIIATSRIKLKANYNTTPLTPRPKYRQCTNYENNTYNSRIYDQCYQINSPKELANKIKQVATDTIPQKPANPKQE